MRLSTRVATASTKHRTPPKVTTWMLNRFKMTVNVLRKKQRLSHRWLYNNCGMWTKRWSLEKLNVLVRTCACICRVPIVCPFTLSLYICLRCVQTFDLPQDRLLRTRYYWQYCINRMVFEEFRSRLVKFYNTTSNAYWVFLIHRAIAIKGTSQKFGKWHYYLLLRIISSAQTEQQQQQPTAWSAIHNIVWTVTVFSAFESGYYKNIVSSVWM